MTYQGVIRNGVVVLTGAPPREGTRVRVETLDVEEASARAGAREEAAVSPGAPGDPVAIAAAGITWAGGNEELDRLLADVQQMREEDLK